MASRKNRDQARDTAKDIILGLAPSGQGPRQPKQGVTNYNQKSRTNSSDGRNATMSSYSKPAITAERRPDDVTISNLQSQLLELQRQNRELIVAEQAARKRIEDNEDTLQRKMVTIDSGVGTREYEDLRRRVSGIDDRVMSVKNDVNGIRNQLDRQTNDLIQINNEMKSRAVVDPSKIANSTQQLDGKVRDLHSQITQLKQTLEQEKTERGREIRSLSESLMRLQDTIRQQEQNKEDILNNLTKKSDMDKEKMSEETKRLNERLNLITGEVTKKMTETQQKIKDEVILKYGALESTVKTQNANYGEIERDLKNKLEEKMKVQGEQLEALSKQIVVDKAKQKDRFQKINEALAALEHHLELGNNKMDKIMNAEIQSRKLHEKGLLSKITEVEDKLNNYIRGLTKSIDDVKAGKENVKIPALDIEALRREMEGIAADKNKLTMEGLLKLEEKISSVQTGLSQDKREISQRIASIPENDSVTKLKNQIGKLDDVQANMEKAQEKIRDKVEKQIPQDLNELSAKADNLKHQLNSRIEKEEEERYLAIQELQEAFQKLQARGANFPTNDPNLANIRREVDECKVAIKKLAESVTTVKNVLDKKITDESKKRENDIGRITRSMNS